MARQDKDFMLRMQGMIYALRIAKEGGVEALEKDIRIRNILRAPMKFTAKQIKEHYDFVNVNVYTNMLAAMLYTLHNSFGFGEKRLKKLQEDYKKNVDITCDLDYMGQHYVRLQDYALELNKNYNLGLDVERIAACEESFDGTDERQRVCRIDRLLEVMKEAGYNEAAAFVESKLE